MVQTGQNLTVEVSIDFRIEDTITSEHAYTTGKKLVRGNPNGNLFSDVFQGLGPAQRQQLPFGLAHGFGEIFCPFNIDMRSREASSVQDFINALTPITIDFFIDDALFLGRKAACSIIFHSQLLGISKIFPILCMMYAKNNK